MKLSAKYLFSMLGLSTAFLIGCSSDTTSTNVEDDEDEIVSEKPNSPDKEQKSSSSSSPESSSSKTYKEESDKAFVQEILSNESFNETNVQKLEDEFGPEEFEVSKYTIFFATMNPASREGENVTLYFDGLEKYANEHLMVYYLPDDFDYNSAAISGGDAILAFRGFIGDHLQEDAFPENDTSLTHTQFTEEVDDVIRTGLLWDGVHRQIMVITGTKHKTSSVLLSEKSGKSLLFANAPSWTADAYSIDRGETFTIPPSTIDSTTKVYFRAEKGILATTTSGEVDRDEVQAIINGTMQDSLNTENVE